MNHQFIFILIGLLLSQADSAPTCSQITTMRSELLSSLLNANNPGTDQNFRALALRLGFHNCVGGCNGCIDLNNPDNAGLEPVVEKLTSLYYNNGYNEIVSLADFIALAAIVSAKDAVEQSNLQRSGTTTSPCPVPCFALQWGRTDSTECSGDELPSPTMTGDQMFAYFEREFGFTKNQVVALMGAHGFGGANTTNSGYSGKWTGAHNKGLSEVFYSHIIDPSLTYLNINAAGKNPPPKWQFKAKSAEGSNAGFMLNTDFEIYYNLTLDSNAKLTCTLNHTCGLTNSCSNYCPMASTFSIAHNYSQDCNAFMTDFVSVIDLMLTNGYTNLERTTCGC